MLENVFVKLQSNKPVPADTKTVRQSTWIKIRAALFILNVSIFLKFNDYQDIRFNFESGWHNIIKLLHTRMSKHF